MSAAELRQAAETLRERAQATRPGPWESVPAGAWTGRVFAGDDMVAKTSTETSDDHSAADYIATVHPGVGLLLAGWLEDAADWEDTPNTVNHDMRAHDIARLINGGERA